jgi:hypothetical protein
MTTHRQIGPYDWRTQRRWKALPSLANLFRSQQKIPLETAVRKWAKLRNAVHLSHCSSPGLVLLCITGDFHQQSRHERKEYDT